MNLMKEFKNKKHSKVIQRLLDNQKSQNIKLVSVDDYVVQFHQSYYFLDCVPMIPANYNVVYKWSNYLSMRVNWNKDENASWDTLKQQYGFVAQVESVEKNKSTNRKDTFTCCMIFNSMANCEKHLHWFNSCFPMEEKEKDKKEAEKSTKAKKKK